jgi:DUF1680 family protein
MTHRIGPIPAAITIAFGLAVLATAATVQPVPFRAPARLADAAEALSPAEVSLGGWLGARVTTNASRRLAQVDLEPLLAGFRRKPGSHPWIGEHVGKWMHAATLAWANTGDPALRSKLDYAAAELARAQEPDGYLGTYTRGQRFGLYQGADWDVWSHKYCLMGLLTYHAYTGDAAALETARKAGDLLLATFGPGRKSILAAGTHVGMAATSVLEPMVLLYRHTGDDRYLEFGRYLVRAWDEPGGPRILDTLLKVKQVNRTANGKAYEMLSNLVGLCELARATGDRTLLDPVLNAWQDIVAKRLYLTGSASQGEHFREDFHLPNRMSAQVAETCVTTTWIQLNWQLLRLTGEARFAAELEKTFYNHLAAAQRPDGAEWCYFTALEGTKPYGPGINCCVSSGPRGMALVPQCTALRLPVREGQPEALLLTLLDSMRVQTVLGGSPATVRLESQFPYRGEATLRLASERPVRAAVRLRRPAWTDPVEARAEGSAGNVRVTVDGDWITLTAENASAAAVRIGFTVGLRTIVGEHGNAGRDARLWGPFVLACDSARNRDLPAPTLLGFADAVALLGSAPGQPLRFATRVRSPRSPDPQPAVLVPFADAGADGGRYAVWLRAPGAELARTGSLASGAVESRSRAGNVEGSIVDDDPDTFVVTFDGQPAAEDWYRVDLPSPVAVRRVVFRHGRTFHDGGWFDTSAGAPRIEILRTPDGAWQAVGRLQSYPATVATDPRGLKGGEAFTERLPIEERAVSVRVVGKPASGDNPRQAFSSCAELEARTE